ADVAIATLKENERNPEYAQFPILDYEMASALLYKQDPACIAYFQQFFRNYKGKLFLKDAWQQMALAYYLQHDIRQANYCMAQIKTQGNAQVDADKQAMRFAEKGVWPNITLLQARLYIDGGYYKQALEKLNTVTEQSFSNATDKLEYYFRLGRAWDELGADNKALQYYRQTINMGRDRTDYFAARAALQSAFIYEHSGQTSEALASYRECLSMRDHDFQSSIDQQAKAGVNRLTVK
ncbi:MAG: tetratricopeptide repeat protein, partial [Flavipsychrobacter sp.]